MTISYNWLCRYLPESSSNTGTALPSLSPEKLSRILTSIGLEVESLEKYESIKGGLNGLIIGEIMECEKHPNADKLKLTKVNTGAKELLQIVCGAPNAAQGQKVIVAPVGATIYPVNGEPLTMKVAKIRSIESYGMICAEDEIGLGTNHNGIIILNNDAVPGTPASEYFKVYTDWIYEIGLTPNRMDAMSHLGVARDVCAYLSHHENRQYKAVFPFASNFKPTKQAHGFSVAIENADACKRYAGAAISGVTVKESPEWLQNFLQAIGQRPINNIVDITNFILHETGQPLHAFDADEVKGKKIIVKSLPEDTTFISLDEKERKLSVEDLMICNGDNEGMCIGGVFGGMKSGVSLSTKNIFLESAWFNPVSIRRSSLRHGLRTEAAVHFEKGVDISNTVNVLKRAALLITEIAGGEINGDIIDVYPAPEERKQVAMRYHYLKKLSGKNYHPDAVKKILESLGFEIVKESMDELTVSVPYNKTDISLPADIVEEVLRIDGIDNIEIPSSVTISPQVQGNNAETVKEKLSNILVGMGFNEIINNSITNSKYYTEEILSSSVKMMNNLSADLDMLRPSMLEPGLESIAWNINRKSSNLQFFEFGKVYNITKPGVYEEADRLCFWITGNDHADGWRSKGEAQNFFSAKTILSKLFASYGLGELAFSEPVSTFQGQKYNVNISGKVIANLLAVSNKRLDAFDIKQAVFFADIDFSLMLSMIEGNKITYSEIPKFPAVQRDIALVVDKEKQYAEIEKLIAQLNLPRLKGYRLFDVFESEKLGAGKKSFAINFTFLHPDKTLTDEEIDDMMKKIITKMEKEAGAEIRK